MKLYLTIFLVIYLTSTSCSNSHNIPQASLKYLNFNPIDKKHPVLDIFEIHFTSDIQIDSLIKEKGGSPSFICLFTNQKEFGVKEIVDNKYNISGYLKEGKEKMTPNGFHKYTSLVKFHNNSNEKNKYLSNNEIKKLLLKKKCIPCKIEDRFFLNTTKPYLSKSMCIPVEDILEAIDE
ncbi:hypothetical protein [Aquimarina aggregata]|uniref:hypothetical protein n=1 Tax=Aquimarina aggregata TaxID=1642818 RepID=UPI0024921369|nr:hypothetical protein [Aquimarina aggregata]